MSVEEIDLFKFLRDDLEMYRRFTKFMNYTNEYGKAIEILEKAEKNWLSYEFSLRSVTFE